MSPATCDSVTRESFSPVLAVKLTQPIDHQTTEVRSIGQDGTFTHQWLPRPPSGRGRHFHPRAQWRPVQLLGLPWQTGPLVARLARQGPAPSRRLWSLGYENAAFKSRRLTFLGRHGLWGFAMPLTARAKNVLVHLKLEGIGTRPLVFVTHSMGGLLVKQLLRTANESPEAEFGAILKQTRGVCFIATPHIGVDLASGAPTSARSSGPMCPWTSCVPEPLLLDLKEWYSNYVTGRGPRSGRCLPRNEGIPWAWAAGGRARRRRSGCSAGK